MVEQQLELFDSQSDFIDDHFFVIEVEEPRDEVDAYPLSPVLDAINSLYGYTIAYLGVFMLSAWLGMILGGGGYLHPRLAIGDLFSMMFAMLLVPPFWPFLILAFGCFCVPLRQDSRDFKALALVALLIGNVAAYAAFADIFKFF